MCPKTASLLHVIFADQLFKRVPQVFARFSGFRVEKYKRISGGAGDCQQLPKKARVLGGTSPNASGRGAGESPEFF
jgi:hypothetical protein